MTDCPRLGKWFGCRFQPRFDKSEPKIDHSFQYTGSAGAERLEQFRQVTYVRDVCVRCGKTIERAVLASTEGTKS